MPNWTKALGFLGAMAVAPLLGGSFALAEAFELAAAPRAHRSWAKQARWIDAATAPAPEPGRFRQHYRVSLLVDRADSQLPRDELELVLGEVNAIWSQAGLCFAMRDARLGPLTGDEIVLRFVSGDDDIPVYGAFDGDRSVWVRDRPGLDPCPHATAHPASHTAGHELGHALGLHHANGPEDGVDRLMASGRRGYRLVPGEIARARAIASELGEAAGPCGAPELL
jgi:hypothetical protein